MFEENSDWGAECKSSSDLHGVLFDVDSSKTKVRSAPDTGDHPLHNIDLKVDHGRKARKRKRKRQEHSSTKLPKPVSDIVQPVSRLPVGAGNTKEPRLQSALRLKMEGKIGGARFRWINQQLYSTTGREAKAMFADDPNLFQVYHKGFAMQVSKWPVNPLDRVIRYVQSLASDKVIADFGCGEAKLAQSVSHAVHSFDFVAHNSHVTACDMAHVPLKKQSVDVCIFCLSLMGTNVSDFIEEARRVIVECGRLNICEIVSRLPSVEEFVHGVERYGFKHVATEKFSRMFVELDFKAVKGRAAYTEKGANLYLKPCNYKRR